MVYIMGEPYTYSLEERYMAKKKRKTQTHKHKLDMLAPHSGFSSREEMVRAMYVNTKILFVSAEWKSLVPISIQIMMTIEKNAG